MKLGFSVSRKTKRSKAAASLLSPIVEFLLKVIWIFVINQSKTVLHLMQMLILFSFLNYSKRKYFVVPLITAFRFLLKCSRDCGNQTSSDETTPLK